MWSAHAITVWAVFWSQRQKQWKAEQSQNGSKLISERERGGGNSILRSVSGEYVYNDISVYYIGISHIQNTF